MIPLKTLRIPLVIVLTMFHQALGQDQTAENTVDGDPVISCLANQMNVSFKTTDTFKGHVYVRGHYDAIDCRKDFSTNQANGGVLEVSYDQCDIRRKREANPKGMMMSAVVIVSFHRQFITKLDKAYRIDCFYLEHDHAVTQEMHVSSLATTEMPQHSPPMPRCRYDVLNSPDGQPVTFARIGDKVYHKWSCDSPMDDMYCMMVHSCAVDSGDTGKIYKLIDETGCTTDRYILDTLRYATDLHAGAESNVFKLADKAHVYFTCQIRLSLKNEHEGNQCPRPECGQKSSLIENELEESAQPIVLNATNNILRRLRRAAPKAAPRLVRATDVDVVAKPVLVLDIDDPMPPRNINRHASNRQSEGLLSYELVDLPESNLQNRGQPQVCLSSVSFGIFIGASVLSCLAASMFLLLFVFKNKIWK